MARLCAMASESGPRPAAHPGRRRRPCRRVRPAGVDRDARRAGCECRPRGNGCGASPRSWATAPTAAPGCCAAARSRLIGVVFGVQHPFHGDLVSGLYAAADTADYELALSAVTPGRDERRAVASLLQDRCEALILLGPQLTDVLPGRPRRQDARRRRRPPGAAPRCRRRSHRRRRRALARPSITSSGSATPASPTSTVDAPPAPPNAAAATVKPSSGTASPTPP